MEITLAFLFNPLVYSITFLITGVSAYYVSQQRTTEYGQLKNLLVAVHVLFIGIIVLEIVRNFYATSLVMRVYTVSNTTFVLVDVILLTLVALTIYLRPGGAGFREILSEVAAHRGQLILFSLFFSYICAAEAILFIYSPYRVRTLVDTVGFRVETTAFTPGYLAILFGVLVAFITYPSTLLFTARRRTKDAGIRRALLLLPIAWIGIGFDLILFEGYLPNPPYSTDASALGYLFAASAFSLTAATFRRATVLSGFFEPIVIPAGLKGPSRSELTGLKVGIDPRSLIGRNVLLEVDPAAGYEELIKALAMEMVADEYAVFTFTSRGSPVYVALANVLGARFYTFSEKVSYPRPGSNQFEILVPRNDQSILLNVLDKTLKTNPALKMAVLFDSISDMILSSSFESTYKFLKQANELIAASGKTAIFLVTRSAQGERESNIVRSLFPNQLAYDARGLEVLKLT